MSTKQSPGWRQRVVGGDVERHRNTVETITPTGHRYRSRAPAPPGSAPPRRPAVDLVSPLQRELVYVLANHRAA